MSACLHVCTYAAYGDANVCVHASVRLRLCVCVCTYMYALRIVFRRRLMVTCQDRCPLSHSLGTADLS